MDFNQLLKQPCIKYLSCSLCKNYLSYFPIHITVDKKNVCGRCELPEDTTCVRNEVYEIIAEEVTFPCRYHSVGCVEKLLPKDMADHEKLCHLRIVKCPVNEFHNCTETVYLPEVTKHCTDKHSDLILKDGNFVIDLSTSESTKQLVTQDDDVFIFTKKFDSTSGILDCSLYSSIPYKQSKEYQIDLQKGSRTLTITGYISDDLQSSKYNSICLNLLQDDKRDSNFIMGTMIIKGHEEEEASKIQFNKEVLKFLPIMLVCSHCSNYSIPSSAVCAYFDSDYKIVCSDCKPNDQYSRPLICSFEKLKKELYFYCPNKKNGCTYMGRTASMQEHKLHCAYESRHCSFVYSEKCQWTGLGKHLVSHVIEKHSKYVATSSLFTLQLSKNYNDNYYAKPLTYVLKLSSYFFLLNFSVKDNCCYWTVRMMSNFEKKFKYEVEIVDTTSCQKLLVTQMCSALTADFTDSNNYCYFQIKQMKGILQNDELMFNIHIFKHCY